MGRIAIIHAVDTVGAIGFVAAAVCALGTREWLQWASERNGCRDPGSIIDAISTISPVRWTGDVVDWNALAEMITVAIWIAFLRVAFLDRVARLRQAVLLFALATQGFFWTGQGPCLPEGEWIHPTMDGYPEPDAVIRSLLLYPYLILSNGATMAIDSEAALLSFCLYHNAVRRKKNGEKGLSAEARFVAIIFLCWVLFFRQTDLPVFIAAAGFGVVFNHAPWVDTDWFCKCCRRQSSSDDSGETRPMTGKPGVFTVADDEELSPEPTARGQGRMSADAVLRDLDNETSTEDTTEFSR